MIPGYGTANYACIGHGGKPDMKSLHKALHRWSPPEKCFKINTIDCHAGGEPLRIITSGYPDLPGKTILERRRFALNNLDNLRTSLMWEPRGHADMYGCVITPPVTADADFGVLFLHNEGYSSMCGHGIIAVTTVALETGMLRVEEPESTVRIDTPAGLVTSYATVRDTSVEAVRFHNVPSFVVALDQYVEIPQLGRIRYDLAFGGAFYAFVDVSEVGLSCTPDFHDALVGVGKRIKQAIARTAHLEHPFEKDLSFLYGTIFVGPPADPNHHSRNVCVFAQGEVDRSPTGTGVSARVAIHLARDEIALDETITVESIVGSTFTGRAVRRVKYGPCSAVVPEVGGTAFITGRHEFLIDPEDPLGNGFILR